MEELIYGKVYLQDAEHPEYQREDGRAGQDGVRAGKDASERRGRTAKDT